MIMIHFGHLLITQSSEYGQIKQFCTFLQVWIKCFLFVIFQYFTQNTIEMCVGNWNFGLNLSHYFILFMRAAQPQGKYLNKTLVLFKNIWFYFLLSLSKFGIAIYISDMNLNILSYPWKKIRVLIVIR